MFLRDVRITSAAPWRRTSAPLLFPISTQTVAAVCRAIFAVCTLSWRPRATEMEPPLDPGYPVLEQPEAVPALEVRNLTKYFVVRRKRSRDGVSLRGPAPALHAVDGVSFALQA